MILGHMSVDLLKYSEFWDTDGRTHALKPKNLLCLAHSKQAGQKSTGFSIFKADIEANLKAPKTNNGLDVALFM